ncbi:hypothetical protein [Sphingorhabdus lutea]|nr:hypothetical protein [Sphingorhabdus lutea]
MNSTIRLLADNTLKHLLSLRQNQLTEWDGIDLSDLSHFLVIQPGDTAAEAEHELGWSLLQNMVDGACYGQPDFTPSWEWIEAHDGWYEFVFIISDDGFGINVFVENHPDTDSDLLAMCREYTKA